MHGASGEFYASSNKSLGCRVAIFSSTFGFEAAPTEP